MEKTRWRWRRRRSSHVVALSSRRVGFRLRGSIGTGTRFICRVQIVLTNLLSRRAGGVHRVDAIQSRKRTGCIGSSMLKVGSIHSEQRTAGDTLRSSLRSRTVYINYGRRRMTCASPFHHVLFYRPRKSELVRAQRTIRRFFCWIDSIFGCVDENYYV